MKRPTVIKAETGQVRGHVHIEPHVAVENMAKLVSNHPLKLIPIECVQKPRVTPMTASSVS